MSIRVNTRTGIATAAVATLLTLGACSGGDSDSASPASRVADAGMVDRDAGDVPAALEPGNADGTLSSEGDDVGSLVNGKDVDAPTVAVISTGHVSLESDDVAKARRDVQGIVDTYLGTISAEETVTSDDGVPEATRLVIRVPSKNFAKAMTDLEGAADLRSSTSGSEDVTTQVIDNDIRIRAQEKSLERIEALLARAVNLNEVIAIESQLARRQAEYDSLKATQAWLKNQTTLSTITLNLQLAEDEQKKDEEATGFLGGLDRGWDGMVATLVGLGTLLGLVLPFAALLALLGVPLWLALRGVRRRQPAAEPQPE
jgi:Domain of unknown function (DUF4349)